jgi:hypothetical protein
MGRRLLMGGGQTATKLDWARAEEWYGQSGTTLTKPGLKPGRYRGLYGF